MAGGRYHRLALPMSLVDPLLLLRPLWLDRDVGLKKPLRPAPVV